MYSGKACSVVACTVKSSVKKSGDFSPCVWTFHELPQLKSKLLKDAIFEMTF